MAWKSHRGPCRQGTALPCGNAPFHGAGVLCAHHFLFVLPKRKRSAPGPKEKGAFCRKFGALRLFASCGSCWLELLPVFCLPSTGCAGQRRSNYPVPAGRTAVEIRGGRGQSALLAPLPLPSPNLAGTPYPQGWNPKEGARRHPYPRGMKSRIRGPRPPWSGRFKGVWGEFRNPPTFLFGGYGGRFSF